MSVIESRKVRGYQSKYFLIQITFYTLDFSIRKASSSTLATALLPARYASNTVGASFQEAVKVQAQQCTLSRTVSSSLIKISPLLHWSLAVMVVADV